MAMVVGLIDIISIITAFQLLLLALFLFNYGRGRAVSHKILAAFLFANALFILDFLQVHLKWYFEFPHLLMSGFSLIFLFGPLLYFYTKSMTAPSFSFRKRDILHAVPFLLYWTYLAFTFYPYNAETKIALFNSGKVDYLFSKIYIYDIAHFLILSYMVASLRELHRFRQQLKHYFSSIEKLNLSWLRLVLYGFLFMWLCDLSDSIILRFTRPHPIIPYLLLLTSLSINLIFATVAVYRSLKQPLAFNGLEPEQNGKHKYTQSTLTESDSRRYLEILSSYMNIKKPFLNPSLTINELAEKLAIPSRHLSQVINEALHQNFYDFVNHYRIEEAKRMLSGDSNDRVTILEVLYEVGFNSKSAFNIAFKKHTGITPTEFKRKNFRALRKNQFTEKA